MIEPYFQGFKDVILSEVRAAKQSVKIAVAWFTDRDVFNVLIKKRQEGVSVLLVLSNDHLNFNQAYSLDFERFKSMGCILVIQQHSFMHHKFCIIDDAVLLMGSVNYTKNGFFKNKESFFKITEEPSTIQDFLTEFESLMGGVTVESGITVSPEKQRLITEVKLLTNQLAWLEIAISDAEKLILDYEIRYRHRFQDILEKIFYLQKVIADKQAQLTQKVEEKEEATQAEQRYQQFKESVAENVQQAAKITDTDLQRELKQRYREGVKLCHPDNPNITDKTKANAIFDTLKKAYENNDLEKVKELVNDLKNGIAFSEDFKDVAIDNLMQLFSRLENKCKILNNQLESLTKDKRFSVMQHDETHIENHFKVEAKRLEIIAEQLKEKVSN